MNFQQFRKLCWNLSHKKEKGLELQVNMEENSPKKKMNRLLVLYNYLQELDLMRKYVLSS